MIHPSRAEFDRAVEQALAEIPEEFQPYLENVIVEVHERPTRKLLRDHDMPRNLLGLYVGVPLEEKGPELAPLPMPDRIYIFANNLSRVSRSWDDLVDQIRVTVLHEVGHHFGLDEDRLEELGYG